MQNKVQMRLFFVKFVKIPFASKFPSAVFPIFFIWFRLTFPPSCGIIYALNYRNK